MRWSDDVTEVGWKDLLLSGWVKSVDINRNVLNRHFTTHLQVIRDNPIKQNIVLKVQYRPKIPWQCVTSSLLKPFVSIYIEETQRQGFKDQIYSLNDKLCYRIGSELFIFRAYLERSPIIRRISHLNLEQQIPNIVKKYWTQS